MKNDIKTLYKYLMSNLQAERQLWHRNYVNITDSVKQIKDYIEKGSAFDDELMTGLKLASVNDFIKNTLFPNKSNGVSANGQSIYSKEMHKKAMSNPEFTQWVETIIKNPSEDNYKKFTTFWKDQFPQVNKVQINRFFAACTTQLSSTVNEGSFDLAFKWLDKHQYLQEYSGATNWFQRNEFLMEYLQKEFSKELNDGFIQDESLDIKLDIDEIWLSTFVWLIYENVANPFNLKKQVVKFGAPGTGKTFQAKKSAKIQFDIWKNTYGKSSELNFDRASTFVQFHSSFSYEDFLEGLRPMLVNGESQLKLQNGIFKNICIDAAKWEIDVFNWNINENWDELKVADITNIENKGAHWDMLEGAKPSVFVKDIIPPYFMLIDEINRAELSRVFGELMYCLEYRGTDGAIKTQYAEMNDEHNGMLKTDGGFKFFVPHNIYIIASMNTIDRSVDSFDFALRRRFKWEEVKPDIALLQNHLSKNYKKWTGLAKNLEKLNDKISNELILGKEYCIGHAYLWKLNYSPEESLAGVRKAIWDDSIGSLIMEYLRGTGKEDDLKEYYKEFCAS